MYDLNKLPKDFKLLYIPGNYKTMGSARPGETIRFMYKSGSSPGYRTVLIVNTDKYGFSGICQERNCEWRRFLYKNCEGGHERVAPFVKIEEVVTTERKITALPVVIKPTVRGLTGRKKDVLTFTNKGGKMLTVETFEDGSVGYRNDGNYSALYSPLEWAQELVKFLS